MKSIVALFVALLLSTSSASSVSLPDKWDRLTCKITTPTPAGTTVGTGFLLRYEGEIFVVSNKHVVTPGTSKFQIGLRPEISDLVKQKGDTSVHKAVDSSEQGIVPGAAMYFADPVYDLAFVHLDKRLAPLFDVTVIPESMIGDDSMIVEGLPVFFLGFPGNTSGKTYRTPLVRGAIVAGYTDSIILLDGNIFGGSSGSPVFLSPDILSSVQGAYLIGVISQSGTVPVESAPFVWENAGIGVAIKIRYVLRCIDTWLSENGHEEGGAEAPGSE